MTGDIPPVMRRHGHKPVAKNKIIIREIISRSPRAGKRGALQMAVEHSAG